MKLSEEERGVVAQEARALASRMEDEEAGRSYEALTDIHGEVPDELTTALGALASLAVETGRARTVHGPAGVRALISVWKRTPQGERAARDSEDLTAALAAIRGSVLTGLRVTATGPGTHALVVSTPECEVRLVVDRTGLRLAGVNVGGGGVGE